MPLTLDTTAEDAAATLKDHIGGKNILITGVSPNSLRAETLRVLAPYAKTIIVASRSKERASESVGSVLKESPKANIKIIVLDLCSGESIRGAATEILALDIPINVVINNAAVAQAPHIVRTEEGFESQFGANHLGHFLLMALLKPAILRPASSADPSRIVNVSSVVANWGGEIRWDDPNHILRPEEYNRWTGYAVSKNANISFAVGIAKRFGPKVLAYSVHPGAIPTTNMGASVPKEDLIAFGVLNEDGSPKPGTLYKTFATGTLTQIIAAFDPSIAARNGAYLNDGVVHNERAPAYGMSEENADKLWELSERMWGIKF